MPRRTPPRLLTIAGSDSGGGAGIQADLKTFAALGAYGMSALTAVTAQNTCQVSAVHPLPPALVAAQIDAVFADIGVDAVKVGMLADAGIVRAVAARLAAWRAAGVAPPVVLDPVMVAASGAPLLADDAVAAIADELLPLAALVTPNLPEAARLTGTTVETEAQQESAARSLAARRPAARPPAEGEGGRGGLAVLVKGGHRPGAEVVDLLDHAGTLYRFARRRIDTTSTHGTGCTLSAAIAVGLAAGDPLPLAVSRGIDYLRGALAAAYPLGGGHGPVDHLYRSAPPVAGDEGAER